MPPATTTTDVFSAIAEPRRRAIIAQLAQGERAVGDLSAALGLAQPAVSKHLHVLRHVGVVSVREAGRQRFYRLNGQALKPVHDWVKTYERMWTEQFDKLDAYLASNVAEQPKE